MSNTTSKRRRDYRAEYQRRLARGLAKGLSRSQARGHPKASEKPIRQPRPISDDALQISLKALRSGKTLAEAARQVRVSPERLRNQAKQLGAIRKQGRKWTVKKTLPRRMLVYSNGQAHSITVGKYSEASKLGRFMAAVGRFLRTNDPEHLGPFTGKSVKDSSGRVYPFETNPNQLYRLALSGSDSFEQVYRIVV